MPALPPASVLAGTRSIPPKPQKTRVKNAVLILAGFSALVLVSLFAWRVAYFASLIRTGQIDLLNSRFVGSQSRGLLAWESGDKAATQDLAGFDNPHLGSPAALVTIVVFADFSCPYSRQSAFTMRSLAARYGDKISYVFRDYPVPELYAQSRLAAKAANCAHAQGKFWEYHDRLFFNQNRQNEADLRRLASELNLEVESFRACLVDLAGEEKIDRDLAAGAAAGVYGTPTFFINGRRIPGAIPEDVLISLIDSLLAKEL